MSHRFVVILTKPYLRWLLVILLGPIARAEELNVGGVRGQTNG